jgi:hypothetical protein
MFQLLRTFNHYRSLIYVGTILIMAFQFYIIWKDRLSCVSIVEYSYKSGKERPVDRAVFDEKITSISQFVNAEIKIMHKTEREEVFIRSILILSKDRETRVYWTTR